METTFCELKNKQVVNVIDGKQLGHISDIVINSSNACIIGLIVPGCKTGFSIFKSPENIFIPYRNICKIGEDVILVEIRSTNAKVKGLSVEECTTQTLTYDSPNNVDK